HQGSPTVRYPAAHEKRRTSCWAAATDAMRTKRTPAVAADRTDWIVGRGPRMGRPAPRPWRKRVGHRSACCARSQMGAALAGTVRTRAAGRAGRCSAIRAAREVFPPEEQHEVVALACHPLTELAAARTHWALRPLAEAAGTWGYLRR